MGKQEGETGINTPHYAEKIEEQTPQVSSDIFVVEANCAPADLRNVRERRCRRYSRSSDTLARAVGLRRALSEDGYTSCFVRK